MLVLISSLVTLGLAASAQTVQVSRDNKTIYVTSEGEAKAEPEIAILTLGYHAWSKTKDALYDETATVSDKVVAALLRAGVKKEMIRTDKTSLTHVEAEPNWPADWKANRVFEAELRWKVTVPVKDAEGAVAIAMQAGATELSEVAWDVWIEPGCKRRPARTIQGSTHCGRFHRFRIGNQTRRAGLRQ